MYVSKKNINIDQIEINFLISQLYFAKIHEYDFVKWFDIFLIQVSHSLNFFVLQEFQGVKTIVFLIESHR